MQQNIEIPISYGVLRGLEFNPRASQKVLAVHGWLDNGASFQPLAKFLGDTHLVAVDLPGHGLSDHRAPGVTYHLVDFVMDVLEASRHLDWPRFHLVGHSLGAGISSLLSVTAPECLLSLTLIDGIGPISGREGDAVERLQRAWRARQTPDNRPPRAWPSIEAAVRARLAATPMQPECARLIVTRNLVQTEQGFRWRTDRRVGFPSPVYLSEALVLEFLRSIGVPVQLVRAAQGILPELPFAPDRIAAIAGLRLHDLAGFHHVHMDDPETVARRILPLIEENSG